MNTESLLPVLLELLAKSAFIALAATLLLRAWRSISAAQRHLVWFVALVTVLMLPLTRLVAPRWSIPLQPAKRPASSILVLRSTPLTSLDTTSLPETTIAPGPISTPTDWRKILLGIWLGGAALLLGYRLFGSWRLHRLMRRSVGLDDSRIRLLLSRTLLELGVHRRLEIRLSGECRVPITWGSLRPVMLLPKAALEWNDSWLTAALRHETAHIARYDYLTRWFAHVACALYWPNPLVWLLARSLRVAQELAADDLVLRAGTPADEYATQLVDAARQVVTQGFFVQQAVAMACPSTLEDRVRAIVDSRRDRRPLSRLAATCGSLTIALVLGISTAAQLRSQNEAPKPSPISEASDIKLPAAPGSQIDINARFVEIDPGVPIDPRLPKEAMPGADKPTIYSDPQFQLIVRALNQKQGVDMLTCPRLFTRSSRRVAVEVVHEFRFPIEWEKDGTIWKPTKLESKNVGTTLEVEPRLKEDGTIELHVIPTVVEFLGFLDLDTGKLLPAPKTAPGDVMEIPPVTPGHRSRAIFSERKRETTVTLHSEETVALPALVETSEVKPFEKAVNRKDIIVFVSARSLAEAAWDEQSKAEKASGNLEGVTDEVFVRRRYLDFLGRVPTPDEVHAFLTDPKPSAEKRQVLIENLTAQLKTGAPVPAAGESAARQKAEMIVIPVLEFKEATLNEALDLLRQKAAESDPEKTGVKIVVKPGTIAGTVADVRLTLSVKAIPVIEALRYVTGLADVEFVVTPDALVVQPMGAGGGSGGTRAPAPPSQPESGAAAPEKTTDGLKAEIERLKSALARSQEQLEKLKEAAGETPSAKPAEPQRDSTNGDPGDLFVNAYMAMQKAEKFEALGDFKSALESMQKAAQGFEQISAAYPHWQPQIVAYRKERVAAAVERLKGRVFH